MKKELLDLLKQKAYRKKEVRLSSGKVSDFYIDVRKVSLSSRGIYLISQLFFQHIVKKEAVAFGGPTLGADPIVGGVCFLAQSSNKDLPGFLIRKSPKKHGEQRLIEGPNLKNGSKVILCDDVATSGGSLLQAKKALDSEGVGVEEVMVVVDRDEGAREALAKAGCNLFSLFTKNDFLIK
ncbi:MAG: orotate phosphoribosyltransferase [Candidatus Omnitrophica bacterium]|nr:orotate phosphoribosyltransferase [Candidatus Omnitrophota bacterium]MCF7891509.1 orotate phosphoribosyltransferase [Candidatus Omnitrophota bacterium]MCF7895778.1 orotate phosphoribosyltransferase [Candidatus Omnitrophota bacterium]MCF7897379.1 orotate phosphoribosyltransferase [Candidatus Omnitrophota bacterium]MCF7909514.1 orotate phosphoribosyltransferase [Candidatus Omnitrophota bacterium]